MATNSEKQALAAAFPDAPHRPNLIQTINASTKYGLQLMCRQLPAVANDNRDLHDVVNYLVVQRLVLGLRDYRLYREGILSFYYVYEAFERVWESLLASPKAVQPHVYKALQAIYDARLKRTGAFTLDVVYLYGNKPDFRIPSIPPTAERKAYVEHIETVLWEKPHLVLAYAHIYYMGFFAGGKMLCRQILAAKAFLPVYPPASTSDEAKAYGTNMFVFPMEAGKDEELRIKFKAAMETIETNLSEAEWTGMDQSNSIYYNYMISNDAWIDIIGEARVIYQRNESLIRELDEICTTLAVSAPGLGLRTSVRGLQYRLVVVLSIAASLWLLKLALG
jgi:heme oxygenase